jgi:hypothetical protein
MKGLVGLIVYVEKVVSKEVGNRGSAMFGS